MKVDISKDDLWALRHIISERVYQMENCPNPSAWGDSPEIGRKFNRKLNQAMKKAFGHDLGAEAYHC